MPVTREPKEAESIEIRLSHAAKVEFMAKCSGEGVTASEAIRAMIDRSAKAPVRAGIRAPRWQAIAAMAAAMALGAGAAAPALAHANQTGRAAFDRLDRNHDGVVSYDEFGGR